MPAFHGPIAFPALPSAPVVTAESYPTYTPAPAQATARKIDYGNAVQHIAYPNAFRGFENNLPPPPSVPGISKNDAHWVSAVQEIKGYTKLLGYFVNNINELCGKWLLTEDIARRNPDIPSVILHLLRPINIHRSRLGARARDIIFSHFFQLATAHFQSKPVTKLHAVTVPCPPIRRHARMKLPVLAATPLRHPSARDTKSLRAPRRTKVPQSATVGTQKNVHFCTF